MRNEAGAYGDGVYCDLACFTAEPAPGAAGRLMSANAKAFVGAEDWNLGSA